MATHETTEQILTRIKQLLAMAADTSSPNEASIAASRARKLMDKHQVELNDLKEKTGFGFVEVDKPYRFMPNYREWLAVAVAKANDCKVIKTHVHGAKSYAYQTVIQGYEADTIVAKMMYEYLTEAIDRLAQTYLTPIMARMAVPRYPAKLGDAFKKEAASAVCQRLRAFNEERKATLFLAHEAHSQEGKPTAPAGTSLVIFKMAEVEAHFGAAKYVTKKATVRRGSDVDAARAHGRKAGQELSLNRQVTE